MLYKVVLKIFLCRLVFAYGPPSHDSYMSTDAVIHNKTIQYGKNNNPDATNQKKYVISTERVNFFEAIVKCKQDDMQLASLTTEEEQGDLEIVLKDAGTSGVWTNGVWLSGTNLINPTSEQFYWLLDGKAALITHWCVGEPNNIDKNDNCMIIHEKSSRNFCWGDNPCQTQLRYVCQYF